MKGSNGLKAIGAGIAGMSLIVLGASVYSLIPTYIEKGKQRRRRGALSRLAEKDRERVIFLTFDDGPDPEYTPRLLDVLANHQVKATFFVVAEAAYENRDIIKRMEEEGHKIEFHSSNHGNGMVMSPKAQRQDFEKGMAIMKKLGTDVKYYRPPWGRVNLSTYRLMKEMNLKLMLWDVMAEDWESKASTRGITAKLLARTGSGDIVCLHDGRSPENAMYSMIEAMKVVIPKWKSMGFEFRALD